MTSAMEHPATRFSWGTLTGNMLGMVIICAAIALSVYTKNAWVPAAAGAGIIAIILCLYYPRLWIYGVILSYYKFMDDVGAGLSATDIFFAFYLFATLFFWYAWMILIAKRKIFYHWIDKLLFIYVAVTIGVNAFVAFDHGTMPLDWAREWVVGILILYYIPIREYFRDRKHHRHLLLVFALLVVACVFSNLISYYRMANASEFAYQISGMRKGTTFIGLGLLFSVALSVKTLSLKGRLPMILFAFFSGAGLVATYVRAYWLAALIVLMVMFLFFSNKERFRAIVMFGVISITGLVLINTVFGRIGSIVTKVIAGRFTSSLKGRKDLSLLARVYEAKKVLSIVEQEPLGGIGLGTNYSYWDPISKARKHYNFVHNGYIGYLMKNGILIALLYFSMHFAFFFHSIKVAVHTIRSHLSPYDKAIAVASACGLLLLFVVSLTSSIFYDRSGGLSFALLFSGVCLTEQKLQSLRQPA